MAEATTPPPLSPEDAARLTDFARAFKAAARAVVLYPGAHPTIAATLGRIVQLTSPAALPAPLKITVLPDALLVDGRAPGRGDQAIGELAALLHSHLVGEMTVHAGGDVEAWRSFLLLLGRSIDSVRAEGGITRLWTTMAGRHVELREIDYTEVLRERDSGVAAAWDQVIANCLQGDAFSLDDETIRALVEIAGNSERLGEMMATLEARGHDAGIGAKTAAVLKMMRLVLEAVTKAEPDRLDPVLRNMATAVGQLSPDLLIGLLSHTQAETDPGDDSPRMVGAVVSRMSDKTIARFVARGVISDGGSPTDRLAQAFQSLVRDNEERQRLLALAKEDVAASALGQTDGFEQVWDHVAQKLLTSYSDSSYVSDEYGRELSRARTQALQVEQVSDDPPERLRSWLRTVATSAVRSLDLTLLLDLLRIERDAAKWHGLMQPVVRLIEDQFLVGDFEAAQKLLGVVVSEARGGESTERRQSATTAIDMLVAGSLLHHIVTHLATVDDIQFDRVKTMCVSLGEVMVRPIAEALSSEGNNRARERLTAIMLAFGNVGRRTVERLKGSANAAVRRTAIQLLRQFGGSDALPELTELLDDNEPQVQREALRAIINLGTDSAYKVLKDALASGTARSRDAIMQSITMLRDERAAPLFAYILTNVDHRGALGGVYLRAIDAIGTLRDPEGVAPLKNALYRGEWWAPRRTAAIRGAAAAALARIGTAEAVAVLKEAARSGPRGVRAVARSHADQAAVRSAREARS